jgi:hypothetical protein
MNAGNWDAASIFKILDAPRTHNFGSNLTILQIDEELKVVIGYTENASVFLGCQQFGDIEGFVSGRARLDASQEIDLKERGLIQPALALSFLVNSEDELNAISTIFAGLYDLNKSSAGTEKATQAAQGFKDYFSNLPKLGMTSEVEVGIFGELTIIEASKRKEELIRGWHSTPDATYDFSFGGKRLEVKTSTRPTRLVWLRSTQTIQTPDTNLSYLSVYAPIDDAGINLKELVAKVRESVSASSQVLLEEKLAFYDLSLCRKRFDLDAALKNLRFISSSDIPVPDNSDRRIIEMRWKCSFELLPADGDASFWT